MLSPMEKTNPSAVARARAPDADTAAPTTVRVVLCDDSFLATEGIAHAIQRVPGVELVATSRDLDSLRTAIERERPDVVLTDVRMPPTNTDEGIRLAIELQSSHPEIGVVVLSHHKDPAYVTALFEAGSSRRAYLLKESVGDASELARAVRAVAVGGSVVDPAVVDSLLSAYRTREESHLETLSPRELEILGLIAQGLSNQAIAAKLVLTKRAVERHINGIFMKLDLGES